jgi:hypothetical protein
VPRNCKDSLDMKIPWHQNSPTNLIKLNLLTLWIHRGYEHEVAQGVVVNKYRAIMQWPLAGANRRCHYGPHMRLNPGPRGEKQAYNELMRSIHDQSCCATRNVAQHDWSWMGPFIKHSYAERKWAHGRLHASSVKINLPGWYFGTYTAKENDSFRWSLQPSLTAFNSRRAGRPGVDSRQGQDYSVLHSIHTASGVHQASYPMRIGGNFPGGKAAGAWSRPPTSI